MPENGPYDNQTWVTLSHDKWSRGELVADAPVCPECGCERSDWDAHDERSGTDYPDCPECLTGQAPAARSPQDEDHEETPDV